MPLWRKVSKKDRREEERKEKKRKEQEKYNERMRTLKKRRNITVHAKNPPVLRIRCGNHFHYHTVRKENRKKK